MENSDHREPAPSSGWIGGPWFDLCFFFGSGALAVAAGLLVLTAPATVLPLWLLWLWMIDGPHLFATWQRSYLDAQTRQRQPRLLAGSLLWLLPGPLLLVATWLLDRPEPFLLFLAAATLWSFHHAVRQHYGLLSIYQRLGGVGAGARRIDSALLYGTLWSAFALFLLTHPTNRALLGLPPAPDAIDRVVMDALTVLLALALFAWALMLALRWRRGSALRPGIFALVVAVGTTLFSFFAVGVREPLLANPLTPEQVFMAAAVVSGVLHGVQYLGIVIATSRRRAALEATDSTLATRLGRKSLLAYAIMLTLSLFYVGLNLLRGAAPIGVAPNSALAQIFLALYWGVFFHHFWLDQKIWRPSSDARLRGELGLGAP